MVKYISIGGKKRPVRFSVGAFRKFKQLTNRNEQEITVENATIEDGDVQLFVALEAGAKKEGIKFDITLEQIREWVDDLDMAEYTDIMTTIAGMVQAQTSDNGETTVEAGN